MGEDRMEEAMSRIEAALARIEAAAANLKEARATGDARLAGRHEALRTRVAAALADLDSVIGDLGR